MPLSAEYTGSRSEHSNRKRDLKSMERIISGLDMNDMVAFFSSPFFRGSLRFGV